MSSSVPGPADVRLGPADLEPPSEARKAFFRDFLGAEEDTLRAHHRLFRFLRNIDCYLQWLTLGIDPKRQERPEVTNHKFRELKPFQFVLQEGDATAGNPLHVSLPAYSVQTRVFQRKMNNVQTRVAHLVPQKAATDQLVFPGPVSLEGWNPVLSKKTHGHYEWPTAELKRCMEGHWPKLTVFAGHNNKQYWVKLQQHKAQEFACHGVRGTGNINNHPVTWFIGIWLDPLDTCASAIPRKTPLFCVKLSYSFRFVAVKALQIGNAPMRFAHQSIAAIDPMWKQRHSHHNVSTHSSGVELEEIPDFADCCQKELKLGKDPDTIPDFLRQVDSHLQSFTLGISETTTSRPEVTTHHFRSLLNYRVGEGKATPEHPLRIHLPAYELTYKKVRYTREKIRQHRNVLVSEQCSVDTKLTLILPGPSCLEYEYSLGAGRLYRGWPTETLAACMSKPHSIQTMHWLVDSRGQAITFSGNSGSQYAALCFQQDISQRSMAATTTCWSIQLWRIQIELGDFKPPPADAPAFCIELCYELDFSPPTPQAYTPQARSLQY